VKAIETTWNGYRFRSRTEARWAVALSVAAIRFEYEGQGFELASGWYLPDFWLPDHKTWLEVKGVDPTPREIALATELARGGDWLVLFAVGPPDPDRGYLAIADENGRFDGETIFRLPPEAYRLARAERFDGKPSETDARAKSRARWAAHQKDRRS
jgi:hypothetical protein